MSKVLPVLTDSAKRKYHQPTRVLVVPRENHTNPGTVSSHMWQTTFGGPRECLELTFLCSLSPPSEKISSIRFACGQDCPSFCGRQHRVVDFMSSLEVAFRKGPEQASDGPSEHTVENQVIMFLLRPKLTTECLARSARHWSRGMRIITSLQRSVLIRGRCFGKSATPIMFAAVTCLHAPKNVNNDKMYWWDPPSFERVVSGWFLAVNNSIGDL